MVDLDGVRVVLTMKQAISGGVAFAGALALSAWGVFALTLGGVRDDVSSIRAAVVATQDAQGRNISSDHETEMGLRTDLGDLTAQLRETTATLSALANSVSGLNGSIQAVDQKITESTSRQQYFERWVVDSPSHRV